MLDNLIIEKACKDDAANMIEYLNKVGGESDNLLFGKDEFHLSVEEEKAFIEKINNSSNSILLIGKINDIIVSIGSLSGSTRKRIAHKGEVALSVSKDYWGLGIGTKVLQALISFAKDTAKLNVIELTVKADNEKAIHLYEKLGFKKIGYYEKYFKVNEIFYDAYLMNLYID